MNDTTSTSLAPNTPATIARPAIGRPRALDEVKLAQICSLAAAGWGLEKTARYIGCAASTIRREARRNPAFAEQLRRASMTSELEAFRAIHRAASTHWRAAAWLVNRSDTVNLRPQLNNARRIKRRIVRPWEPSERDQFVSKVQGILATTVTDNALLCQLIQQIQAQLTPPNPHSPTPRPGVAETASTENLNHINVDTPESFPPTSSFERNSSHIQQI